MGEDGDGKPRTQGLKALPQTWRSHKTAPARLREAPEEGEVEAVEGDEGEEEVQRMEERTNHGQHTVRFDLPPLPRCVL